MLRLYFDAIRSTLAATLCFPPQTEAILAEVGRVPAVELCSSTRSSRLILQPLTVRRNEGEFVRFDSSCNSVLVSIFMCSHCEIESVLVDQFCGVLMHRADRIPLLRRAVPNPYADTRCFFRSVLPSILPLPSSLCRVVTDYAVDSRAYPRRADLCFLITRAHLQGGGWTRETVCDFVVESMSTLQRLLCDSRIGLHIRAKDAVRAWYAAYTGRVDWTGHGNTPRSQEGADASTLWPTSS